MNKIAKGFAAFTLTALVAIAGVLLLPPGGEPAHAENARVNIFTAAYTTQFDLADGAGATLAVPAPGAILGDACVASLPVDAVDMLVTCYIQAAGAAEIRVQNESAGASDIAAGTARVFHFPRGTR